MQNLSDSRFQYCVRELFQIPLLYAKPLQTCQTTMTQYIRHPPRASNNAASLAAILSSSSTSSSGSASHPTAGYSLSNLPRPSSTLPLSSLPPPPVAPPSPPSLPPLTGGFINGWSHFSLTNRLLIASLYIDGSHQPIELKFNDEVSFERSERPLIWICPWAETERGEVEAADNWELVTNLKRQAVTEAEIKEQDRLHQLHKQHPNSQTSTK